jgi:hypothetical protein
LYIGHILRVFQLDATTYLRKDWKIIIEGNYTLLSIIYPRSLTM